MWFVIAIILAVLGLIVWATTRKSRLGHWARVTVMCVSGGFIFPHAMAEEDEYTAKHYSQKGTKIKTG